MNDLEAGRPTEIQLCGHVLPDGCTCQKLPHGPLGDCHCQHGYWEPVWRSNYG